MVKAKAIEIGFSEHPNHRKPKRFEGDNCWGEAQRYLNDLAEGTQHDVLGRYKTDFVIEWENGEGYGGTLGLRNLFDPTSDHRLRKHIHDHALFYSGRHQPAHMNDKDYALCMGMVNADTKAHYNDLLDNYDIQPLV